MVINGSRNVNYWNMRIAESVFPNNYKSNGQIVLYKITF